MERKPTEIRQEEIKRAFLEIVDSEGLHNLSTRKLAEKVGVTEGALFRHFKSKRDIVLSIVDSVEQVLMNSLQNIAMSNGSSKERLFKFLCVHVKYLIENSGITMLLFSEAAHSNDPELKARMLNILNLQRQLAKKIIQDGIVSGEWDSSIQVENVAMLYMGIPISLNIELILNPYGVNTDNFCKRMMCLLERALKKTQ
jgi:AcrR family transcriptional regulator